MNTNVTVLAALELTVLAALEEEELTALTCFCLPSELPYIVQVVS
jgi:hypothetical protein